MEITLYIDVLFFVNLAMNFFLLWMLRMILKLKAGGLRLGAAGAAGAVISVAAAILVLALQMVSKPLPAAVAGLIRLSLTAAGGILMVAIAFRPKTILSYARMTAALLAATFLTGGILEWVLSYLPPLSFLAFVLVLAGGCFLSRALAAAVGKAVKEDNIYYQVTLFHQGRTIKTEGLLDTGNHLVEPVSGKPVQVGDKGLLLAICPVAERILYIPYRTIDGGGKMLTAVVIDRMEAVQGERRIIIEHPILAASPRELSQTNAYLVLLNKQSLTEK